jgi:subtilisin
MVRTDTGPAGRRLAIRADRASFRQPHGDYVSTISRICAVAAGLVFGIVPPGAAPALAAGTTPTNTAAAAPMIVTLRREADADVLVKGHGLRPRHTYHHALNGFAASLTSEQAARLRQDPRVVAVEADGQIVPARQTVPTGVLRMGITNFPVAHINGQDHRIDVDVAVMDTGIQTNHPDLNVVQWADFTGEGWNGNDRNGHGTHVAGIIGALDNDFGVVGVAPGARLWSVQVIGQSHHDWGEFIAGCDYIFTNADKIAVVNASLTGVADSMGPYAAVHLAVSNLVSVGVVFIAAAGNDAADLTGGDGFYGGQGTVLPAGIPEVMAVSAMNPTNDTIADFSNFSFVAKPAPASCPTCILNSPGLGIDLAAPGVDILSTWIGSSYALDSGTSMAGAHVSGLVALYVAANGRAHSIEDVYRIRQTLINNSQPQAQWTDPNSDPDGNPEPLAFPSEAWVPTPTILSQAAVSNSFAVGFTTVPGYTYAGQFNSSVINSNQWIAFAVTNGEGGAEAVTLTDPAPDPVTRVYRLLRTPSP